MKHRIKDLIAMGADPSALGRRAHYIQDYLVDGKLIWCKTPAHGWHAATPRELGIINPPVRVIQHKPREQQLVLEIG